MLTRYSVVRNSFLWLVVLLTFLACEQDAEEILVPQPVANLRLINNDSLQAVTTSIDSLTELQDSLLELEANVQFELEILNDSLAALEAGIDTGNTNLIPLLEEVNAAIDSRTNLLTKVEAGLEPLDEILDQLSDIVSIINSGLVFVDAISNTSFPGRLTFEDSLQLFELPLDMNRESIVYDIDIGQGNYRMGLSYRLREELNARGQLRLFVDSLSINSIQNFDTAYLDEEGIIIALF
jgi:hypothetical protein